MGRRARFAAGSRLPVVAGGDEGACEARGDVDGQARCVGWQIVGRGHLDLGLATADGAELAVAFAAAVPAPAKVLLPGPAKRLREPRNTLERAGFTVTELPLYATAIVPAAELPATPLAPGDIVFFCSPSAVRAFVGAWSERPDCVAIGETTAATARDAGFPTRVAATPDLEAMVLAAGLDPIPAPATPRSGS